MSQAGLLDAGANVALAILFGTFAAAHVRAWLAHPRPSLAMIVAMEATAAAFFLARRSPRGVSWAPWSVAVTVAGTFVPMLLRPTGAERDALAGQLVQALGFGLATVAYLSLNRSLGLLPANRGVRTGGLYRLVRHPLYAAYTVGNVGYLASNPSARNAAIVVAAFAAQVLRIRAEEAFLASDPEYAAYARRTRWRLLPFVY